MGNILTIDLLLRRGFILASRYYPYHEIEESMDHITLHCVKTRVFVEAPFSMFGIMWVNLKSIWDTLLS